MTDAQAQSTKSETFEKRLRAYAVGAGAAAAGLLAFSAPAAAEIVVVPAHVYLGSNSFPIEIEGTTAFTLTNQFFDSSTFGYCVSADLFATAASGAGVVGHGRSNQVAPLKFGAVIAPADQFQGGKQLLADGISCRDFGWGVGGPFANTKGRFLGLKFELDGQVYYGLGRIQCGLQLQRRGSVDGLCLRNRGQHADLRGTIERQPACVSAVAQRRQQRQAATRDPGRIGSRVSRARSLAEKGCSGD